MSNRRKLRNRPKPPVRLARRSEPPLERHVYEATMLMAEAQGDFDRREAQDAAAAQARELGLVCPVPMPVVGSVCAVPLPCVEHEVYGWDDSMLLYGSAYAATAGGYVSPGRR